MTGDKLAGVNDHAVYDLLWTAAERLEAAARTAETPHARTTLETAARDLRLLALVLLHHERE